MKSIHIFIVFTSVAAFVSAYQKCSGTPRMYNGKKCASTTRYADYHRGACGCGPDDKSDSQYQWNHAGFNTAPNQLVFDHAGGGWCGENCGRCVRLTTTGGWVDGQGGQSPTGSSKVFMITNLCPNEFPNLSWCSQANGRSNQYGYGWHFDLENGVNQITSMGWHNPEVTWEWADCDEGHRQDGRTPTTQLFKQCYCSTQYKRSINQTMVPIV